jgi:hypothetical protein
MNSKTRGGISRSWVRGVTSVEQTVVDLAARSSLGGMPREAVQGRGPSPCRPRSVAVTGSTSREPRCGSSSGTTVLSSVAAGRVAVTDGPDEFLEELDATAGSSSGQRAPHRIGGGCLTPNASYPDLRSSISTLLRSASSRTCGYIGRGSLRIKRVVSAPRIWEMTWSFSVPDGRVTFEWVEIDDTSGIRWRRIGTHEIFREP